MAQGSSIDASRLSTGEKIVLGAAGAYFVWAFLPVWYKLGAGDDMSNGLYGMTLIAWILAIVALAEIVVRSMLSIRMQLPAKPGVIHVGVAAIALVLTVLGLVVQPSGYDPAWGLFVGIILALAWIYGAYMMYSQPEIAPTSPADNGITT